MKTKTEIYNELVNRLKIKQKLTLKEIARRSGISHNTLTNWKHNFTGAKATKMKVFLNFLSELELDEEEAELRSMLTGYYKWKYEIYDLQKNGNFEFTEEELFEWENLEMGWDENEELAENPIRYFKNQRKEKFKKNFNVFLEFLVKVEEMNVNKESLSYEKELEIERLDEVKARLSEKGLYDEKLNNKKRGVPVQKLIAKAMGVSKYQITSWKKGLYLPSRENLEKLYYLMFLENREDAKQIVNGDPIYMQLYSRTFNKEDYLSKLNNRTNDLWGFDPVKSRESFRRTSTFLYLYWIEELFLNTSIGEKLIYRIKEDGQAHILGPDPEDDLDKLDIYLVLTTLQTIRKALIFKNHKSDSDFFEWIIRFFQNEKVEQVTKYFSLSELLEVASKMEKVAKKYDSIWLFSHKLRKTEEKLGFASISSKSLNEFLSPEVENLISRVLEKYKIKSSRTLRRKMRDMPYMFDTSHPFIITLEYGMRTALKRIFDHWKNLIDNENINRTYFNWNYPGSMSFYRENNLLEANYSSRQEIHAQLQYIFETMEEIVDDQIVEVKKPNGESFSEKEQLFFKELVQIVKKLITGTSAVWIVEQSKVDSSELDSDYFIALENDRENFEKRWQYMFENADQFWG